jgi:hypothetical protein
VAYQLWICGMALVLGIGPATTILRACRLQAYYWLPLTIAAACALSYILFWLFFFNQEAGRTAAIVCWWASVALFAWELWRSPSSASASASAILRARDAWLPLVLLLIVTTAYLCLLLPHDGPINVYIRQMPPDNVIPLLLANRIDPQLPVFGPQPHFLLADWLGSDRPPLQSAVLVAIRPFASSAYPDLTYQAIGTICQLAWLPALYALARQLDLTRRQTAYMLVGCACSGFFVSNSLYVWPKLLPGGLFVTAFSLILQVARERRVTVGLALIIGSLLALSMLSHGGSLFPLLALPALWVACRGWRFITRTQIVAASAAAAAFLVWLAPWMAYQRFCDPPGNRLMKFHLAGAMAIDDRGTLQTIVEEYAKRPLMTHLAARWTNVKDQFWFDPRPPEMSWRDWIRREQFFHHLAALDVLALGLIGLWRPALRRVRLVWLFTILGIAIWCVLMFGPDGAFVTQGSYALTMLLFFCAGAGLAEWPRPIRVAVMAAHLSIFAFVWLT